MRISSHSGNMKLKDPSGIIVFFNHYLRYFHPWSPHTWLLCREVGVHQVHWSDGNDESFLQFSSLILGGGEKDASFGCLAPEMMPIYVTQAGLKPVGRGDSETVSWAASVAHIFLQTQMIFYNNIPFAL